MNISNLTARAFGNTAPDFGSFYRTPEGVTCHRSANPGPIEDLFYGNDGRVVHKWAHYLPIYDEAFAPLRDGEVTMLEIGVAKGGSLDLWRRYFGPDARIMGIDINSDCAERVEAPNMVRIGSQDDPAFLADCIAELGAPNIIVDDGSHIASHVRASFRHLFPTLQVGGVYLIEDLHTSYWHNYGGGYQRRGTGIEMVKELIDDMHGWHHARGEKHAPRTEVGSIKVFDSVAIIQKANLPMPVHVKVGA